jgi:putative flippase GtrA
MTRQRTGTLGRAIRFLVVGGANTLVTYLIFFLLGLIIPPWLAYTIAFAIGLAWTALASSSLVFRVTFSWRRVLLFVVYYLAVFGLGQLVIRLIDPGTPLELLITSAVVLVVTTPLTFIGGHFIFRPDAPTAEPPTTQEPPA